MDVVLLGTAIENSLDLYFTGKPCKRGHLSQRHTSNSVCVECQKFHNDRLYQRNRTERIAVEKAKVLANPEKYRKYWSEYQKANREKHRVRRLLWRANNRETLRPKGNARSLAWTRANPAKAAAIRQTRRCKELGAEGRYIADDIVKIRKAQRDCCAYCKCKLDGRGTIDHIVAFSKGGTNWPRNLQLTCQSCNSSKCAKDPIDFAHSQGLLV